MVLKSCLVYIVVKIYNIVKLYWNLKRKNSRFSVYSQNTLLLFQHFPEHHWYFWLSDVPGFSPTKQFVDASWMSYSLTEFWLHLSGHERLPFHCPQMSVTSPGCYLCFWLTGYKLKVPTNPSSNHLLERLTKLRKRVHLLDYWFIIKGVRWKRCIGQSMREGAWSFYALSRHTTLPERHVFINPEAPQPYLFKFLWQLHYIGMID